MSALQICTYLGLPWFLGMALLRLMGLDWRSDKLAYWGWAWALGCLGSALVLKLWWLSTPVSREPWTPALGMLALALGAYFLGRKLRPWTLEALPQARLLHGPRWERAFFRSALCLALGVSFLSLFEGTLFAVYIGEEATRWSLPAKQLFHAGTWSSAASSAPKFSLNPILQSWCFLNAGEVTHVANRLIIQLFAPALILVLAGAMRLWVRPAIAGLLLLISTGLAPFQSIAWTGHSAGLVGLSALLVLDGALRWKREQQPAWSLLVLLGLGLAWVSDDAGYWVIAAGLTAAASVQLLLRWRPKSSPQAMGAGICLLPLPIAGGLREGHLDWLQEFLFGRWTSAYLLGVCSLLCLALVPRRLGARLGFGALFVGLMLLALLTLPTGLNAALGETSMDPSARQLMLWLPTAMLWLATCCGERLGLSPGTYDPRAAAQALGWRRPLRSMLIAYLVVMAGSNLTSAVLHGAQTAGVTLPKTLGWSEQQRLEQIWLQADARAKWSIGSHRDLFAALDRYVAPGQALQIAQPDAAQQRQAAQLRAFLYPRTMPQAQPPGAFATGSFWLALDERKEAPIPGVACVAAGDGWSLWH